MKASEMMPVQKEAASKPTPAVESHFAKLGKRPKKIKKMPMPAHNRG